MRRLALVALLGAAACGDDAPPDRPPAHPFGTHGGYRAAGVIFPSGHTQAELDAATAAFYDTWKARYVAAGCASGQARIDTSSDTAGAFTVSEGHGYGMLVTVLLAGHDPDARITFDALFRYFDAHRSEVNDGLMAWAQDAACQSSQGADSATDGDLDIAYALLLADAQWGSDGEIDYHAEALRVIEASLASDIHPANSILVGDWANDPADPHYTGTRPSDFMTGHFHAFARASGAARWNDVADKTYQVIDALQTQAAPATGLLPDFAVNAPSTTPAPAPADWLEGADDGHYSWNACRTPWRIASDYLLSGEPRSQTAVRRMNAWFRTQNADDPTRVVDGYALDGTPLGTTAALAFVAPLAVGAMVEPASGTNQPWLDALWNEMVARPPGDYYGNSLKLLAMIVVSGNWWAP